MGIGDSSILAAGADMDEVIRDMMSKLVDEESSSSVFIMGRTSGKRTRRLSEAAWRRHIRTAKWRSRTAVSRSTII